ncbi:MEMO1 family protein [Fusarium oxysporum f. sp. albedinis]|nr:MEMO1 family protein [Fusarium oxysporum f. sp. albedinis]
MYVAKGGEEYRDPGYPIGDFNNSDIDLSDTRRCPLVKKRHCVVNDSASHNKSLKPFRVLERAIDPGMEPSITKNSKQQVEESSALTNMKNSLTNQRSQTNLTIDSEQGHALSIVPAPLFARESIGDLIYGLLTLAKFPEPECSFRSVLFR